MERRKKKKKKKGRGGGEREETRYREGLRKGKKRGWVGKT